MSDPDPLIASLEEQSPPHPALSAFKRALWIIITLLVILSLLISLILPALLSRRTNPRRDPENEVQTHWISTQCI